MCLCLFAIGQHEEYPFILLANRDEFRARPAAKAAFWEDHPTVLAGRDHEGMGTWLGMNTKGELAFLTNYRHPDFFNRKGPTRGKLVSEFLTSDADARQYLSSIQNPEAYNGFNLVAGTPDSLFYYSNTQNEVVPIGTGIHGLSNAFLDTPWTKVTDGKAKLRDAIRNDALDTETLFTILRDSALANEEDLPETGVPRDLEKLLSAKFINTPNYGTVCSTVILVDRNGRCLFEEKTFDADGNEVGKVGFEVGIS